MLFILSISGNKRLSLTAAESAEETAELAEVATLLSGIMKYGETTKFGYVRTS